MNIRRVIAILGLPVLLLGLVTTSAAAGSTPSPAPAMVKHSVDHEHCDPIRFLKP
ncbi:hypothetical protein GCM10009630_49570 [Kribbella jejuensis]|uniref:Uncharacterized protein n=1 Tax=Kribbella jejuensis TaxID=236068 RepID=A0A542E7Q0_9ACTN|nr:hypothetical protein [Kribbella jejuensis]TQJ11343.1 hypothetical protein FB475_4255 [Kribbella jejuensis]